jgi:hypothetical protein
MKKIIIIYFTVVLVISLLGFSKVNAEPSPVQIFKKIADTRRSLKSGHISVEIQAQITGKPSSSTQLEIFFDGSQLRLNKDDEVVCLDCYSKYTRFYYKADSESMKYALVFYDGYDKPGLRMMISDPRWTGTIASSFLQLPLANIAPLIYDYDYAKNGLSMKLSSDNINGQQCWKVTFPSPFSPKSTGTIWVDQSITERIIRSEFQLTSGDNYVDRIDVQEFHENNWFPTKTLYQRLVNGKLEQKIEETFQVFSLNKALPQDTFSPKGVSSLKPGTGVEWNLNRDKPAEGNRLEWDGEKIIAVDSPTVPNNPVEVRRFYHVQIFFILIGIALILFGIGLELLKRTKKL